MVERSDSERRDYFRRCYNVDDEQPADYDFVVNTGLLSTQQITGLVVSAATARGGCEAIRCRGRLFDGGGTALERGEFAIRGTQAAQHRLQQLDRDLRGAAQLRL